MNVVLIGMSGAGKSTIGVLLAKALGMDYVDTDILMQQHEGRFNRLAEKNGIISKEEAMQVLKSVASRHENDHKTSTLWSLIYDMSDGDIQITMGANYEKRYDFNLRIKK